MDAAPIQTTYGFSLSILPLSVVLQKGLVEQDVMISSDKDLVAMWLS
jgi:hypothetical protein